MKSWSDAGVIVYSRDGKRTGVTTGATYPCQLAGCNGVRVVVRWTDGKITRPCSKGLEVRPCMCGDRTHDGLKLV